MKFIYSHEHRSHDPQQFMVRGQLKRSNEQPERAEILLRSAQKAGHQPMLAEDFGPSPRAAVHTPEYLHFLQTAWQRWQALPDASLEVLPNVFPFPGQPFTYPDHLVGQAGYHMGDCACSMGEHTWHAAINSAHCATHAAELVLQGEQAAYALCRPPGHHVLGVEAALALGAWVANEPGRPTNQCQRAVAGQLKVTHDLDGHEVPVVKARCCGVEPAIEGDGPVGE